MSFPVRKQSGVLVVTVSGRIDHVTSEEFARSLEPLLKACLPDAPPLLLDFTAVEYISSAGLRVLMMFSRQAKAQRGTFAIASLQPLVHEVFSISRFNLIMPCYLSVDAACKVIGQ